MIYKSDTLNIDIIDVEVPFSNNILKVLKIMCTGKYTIYISLCTHTTSKGLNDLFFGVSKDNYGFPLIVRSSKLSEMFSCGVAYLNRSVLKTMYDALLMNVYDTFDISIPVPIAEQYFDIIIKNFKRFEHYCEVAPVSSFTSPYIRGTSRTYQGFKNCIYGEDYEDS